MLTPSQKNDCLTSLESSVRELIGNYTGDNSAPKGCDGYTYIGKSKGEHLLVIARKVDWEKANKAILEQDTSLDIYKSATLTFNFLALTDDPKMVVLLSWDYGDCRSFSEHLDAATLAELTSNTYMMSRLLTALFDKLKTL